MRLDGWCGTREQMKNCLIFVVVLRLYFLLFTLCDGSRRYVDSVSATILTVFYTASRKRS